MIMTVVFLYYTCRATSEVNGARYSVRMRDDLAREIREAQESWLVVQI